MVRRRSTVRFRKGALESEVLPDAGRGIRVRRRGSSGGQSTRLIIVVSRVQVPPPLPRTVEQRASADVHRTITTPREGIQWPAGQQTSDPRSLWRAPSAKSATTSPARTGATIRTGWSSRSTAPAAGATDRTARPADLDARVRRHRTLAARAREPDPVVAAARNCWVPVVAFGVSTARTQQFAAGEAAGARQFAAGEAAGARQFAAEGTAGAWGNVGSCRLIPGWRGESSSRRRRTS